MDELTLEQAWQNVATAAAQFQGNQQQWGVLNASIAKVNEALTAFVEARNEPAPAPFTAVAGNGKVHDQTAADLTSDSDSRVQAAPTVS